MKLTEAQYEALKRARADKPAPRALAEKTYQAQIVAAAKLKGWRVYHTFDSRRSAPGFPDLVLVRPPRLVFLEVKTARGRVRPEQQVWLDELKQVESVEAELVRPDDWDAVLERLR